jgi:WD40 repeat protein
MPAGKVLGELNLHGAQFNGLRFGEDNLLRAWFLNTIWLIDPATGQRLGRYTGYTGEIMDISPDGSTAAVYDHEGDPDSRWNGLMRLWNVEPVEIIYELEGSPCDGSMASPGYFYSAAFSPDGGLLAAGENCAIWIWSTKTGELHHHVTDSYDNTKIAFSPSGDNFSAISYPDFFLWNSMSGQKVQQFKREEYGRYTDFTFSPDSSQVVTAESEQIVYLWDIASAQIVKQIPTTGATSLAVSPDGRILAVGSEDGKIYIWDIASTQLITALSGHLGSVDHLAFSADGRIIASTGDDGSIRLWSIPVP